MTTKASKARRLREATIPLAESDVSGRVTVSIDPKLLKIIDKFANSNNLSRSSVFEKALLLWYEALQEEADKEFYSHEAEDPKVNAWSKITSKSIKYLWND